MIVNLADMVKNPYELQKAREKKILETRSLISSWPKKKLQNFVYNNIKEHPISDAAMSAILERFINTNEFRIGTMSEELKSGFDIVRAISRNHKILLETTDLINDFIKHYEEVIKSYDRQSSQTYYYKLKADYKRSVELVNKKIQIEEEMRVKY